VCPIFVGQNGGGELSLVGGNYEYDRKAPETEERGGGLAGRKEAGGSSKGLPRIVRGGGVFWGLGESEPIGQKR